MRQWRIKQSKESNTAGLAGNGKISARVTGLLQGAALTFRFYRDISFLSTISISYRHLLGNVLSWLAVDSGRPEIAPMSDHDPIEIEQRFAAQVVNAQSYARLANTAGFPQNVPDQVCCALADLWDEGIRTGLSCSDVMAIVDRYVVYDEDGEAWPRPMGNVVPFGRH